MQTTETWKQNYQTTTENPPAVNAILKGYGNELARLTLELAEGKPPFIYGRAHVPAIVGQAIDGWVLQHLDTKSNFGWKCVLLPKAREEVLRRFPNMPSIIPVKALRVVRYSRTGNSILCEVAEWATAEEIAAAAATE